MPESTRELDAATAAIVLLPPGLLWQNAAMVLRRLSPLQPWTLVLSLIGGIAAGSIVGCDGPSSSGALDRVCKLEALGEIVLCRESYNNGELSAAEAERHADAFLNYCPSESLAGTAFVAPGPCEVTNRLLGTCTYDDSSLDPELGMRWLYYSDPREPHDDSTQMLIREHECYVTLSSNPPDVTAGGVFERAARFPTEAVAGPLTATAIAAGAEHVCVIRSDSSVWCWGCNGKGQLGMGGIDEAPHSWPHQVPDLHRISALASVPQIDAMCALRDDGSVFCWGDNRSAQVDGVGADESVVRPRKIDGVSDAVAIAMSGYPYESCALINDGSVSCWGADSDVHTVEALVGVVDLRPDLAQLADGSWVDWRGTPTDLPVDADPTHPGCYVSDGQAWCGTPNGYQPVASLTGVVAVTRSMGHMCFQLEDATLWCQAEEPSISSLPSQPISLLGGVRSMDSGSTATCLVLEDDTVACLGINGCGELGRRGLDSDQPSPVLR